MARKITHRRAAAILLRSRIEAAHYAIESVRGISRDNADAIAAEMEKIGAPMVARLDRIAGDLTESDVEDVYGRPYGRGWSD
jgi:hypothetical protein